VASWNGAQWTEIEFTDTEAISRFDRGGETIAQVGWVNGRYLRETETTIPPDIEKGSFFGERNLDFNLDRPGEIRLRAPFGFRDSKGVYWRVPAGFVSDGASIPGSLWSFVGSPLTGQYVGAAVVHDYFCVVRRRSWRMTHKVFYEAMLASGVNINKARELYTGVMLRGPRWIEGSVPCLYACAEPGEIAAVVWSMVEEGDLVKGKELGIGGHGGPGAHGLEPPI
jgi:hypothetical protein